MPFAGRLGCFFLIIGIGLLGLFLASDASHSPDFNFLLAGVVLTLVGWRLWAKAKPAPRRSGRFRILRRSDPEDENTDQPPRR